MFTGTCWSWMVVGWPDKSQGGEVATIHAAVYLGEESLQVQEWPTPEPAASEVLVQVRHAGICGTDRKIYSGKHPGARPPRVLGHEVSGPSWKQGPRLTPGGGRARGVEACLNSTY